MGERAVLLQNALAGFKVMVLQLVLVSVHLAIQFVYQLVYCCIQVFMATLRKQVIAFDMDIAFRSLS